MNVTDLRRILTAFADKPADVDLSRGSLVIDLRGNMIEAKLVQRHGELSVVEGEAVIPAARWVVDNVARLQLMADRILEYTPEEPHFVVPGGALLDRLDQSPDEQELQTPDALASALRFLDQRPGGMTSMLYLTSDAGEGKTTLITQMARAQAKQYKAKQSDWILVPISLGGRNFIRFDDVVAGELMNDYRFPYWYYGAFLELVRLGVVVPAFDGFEEMFVENSEGDAISALGNLVQSLQSGGSALLAARKAYFEYKSLKTQSRLHDTRGEQSVSFSRLCLRRWDREKFVEYGDRRGTDGEGLYTAVSAHLAPDHSLLTRAVLVHKLFDVAEEVGSVSALVGRLTGAPADYFREFVGSIIRRESNKRWLTKGADVVQMPLIPEVEHYELLSLVALEMWRDGTESLRAEVLDLTAELFCDLKKKDKTVARQVVERLKGHALIGHAGGQRFAFDHQEFYHFFLGEGLGQVIASHSRGEVSRELRYAPMPVRSTEAAVRYLLRTAAPLAEIVRLTNDLARTEPRGSFTKENLGGVLLRSLDGGSAAGVRFDHASFPPQALAGRRLTGVEFEDCYFESTSLDGTQLADCRFVRCEFEPLELTGAVGNPVLVDSIFRSVTPIGREVAIFSPEQMNAALAQAGFQFPAPPPPLNPILRDDEVTLTERLLRTFTRQSQINENVLETRLGIHASTFFRDVLPQLERVGVLADVPYAGKGQQRRFALGKPLERLTYAIEQCEGSFKVFLQLAEKGV